MVKNLALGSIVFFAFFAPAVESKDLPSVDEKAEPPANIVIQSYGVVVRPDSSLRKDTRGWATGKLGGYFEHSIDPRGQGSSVSASPMPTQKSQRGWVTLRAKTGFELGKGITLNLEWMKDGRVTRTEDAVIKDFGSITRTLYTDPATRDRYVVRFTPSLEREPEPEKVSEMGLPFAFGPFLRNGVMLADPGGSSTCQRHYINIPGSGFFQFSLFPFEGAQPIGKLDGNVLSFKWHGEDYRIYSRISTLAGGPWTVYLAVSETPPTDLVAPLDAAQQVTGCLSQKPRPRSAFEGGGAAH